MTTNPYDLARSILGPDLITPEEAVWAFYTRRQLVSLYETLPGQKDLEWCRNNGMFLVAGPPTAMSLLDVRALNPDFFYSKGPDRKNHGWYDNASEKFARTDKVEALCWLALGKEPVENSLNKTWPDQQALVEGPMMVPNAAEVAWALTTYKAVRDIYLLEDLYVRTSSIGSDGDRVHVGGFGADGLLVSFFWDGFRNSRLGVSASRKFWTSNP